MRDKDYSHMTRELIPMLDEVFTVTPNNPRSMEAAELAEIYKSGGVTATAFNDIRDGVKAAVNAAREKRMPLFILGSLYLYCDVYSLVEEFAD